MKVLRFFVLVVVCMGVDETAAKSHQHTFVTNTNFDNPARWIDAEHGVPCAGDTVQFEPNKKISVFVQTNATITEMVFPTDGDFIFDNGVVWGTDATLSSCQEGDHGEHVVSYLSDADSWFDKKNWKHYDGSTQLGPKDLLDMEQVPCDYDQANFLSGYSWTISIPLDVSLTSLQVYDQFYTSSTFETYRKTGSGYYQFQGEGAIVTGNGCSDKTGCVCRSNQNAQDTQGLICSQISCPGVSCKAAISPVGQCCLTCGALLNLEYGPSYTEASMITHLSTMVAKPEYVGCHPILSKVNALMETARNIHMKKMGLVSHKDIERTQGDYIQILVTDDLAGSKEGSRAQRFAKELYDYVSDPSNDLGIINATLSSSGPNTGQQHMSGGAIAGIIIGVILAMVLVSFAVVQCYRSTSGLASNPFKKLVDYTTNVDNPLYDFSLDEKRGESSGTNGESPNTSVTGIPSINAVTSDFGITFGNPLYNEEDV